MVMQSGEYVRYTFVTDTCCDDLSAMLNCMTSNRLLPSTIHTSTDEHAATRVVVDTEGTNDAHMRLIATGIGRRPGMRSFGYERIAPGFQDAA